MVLHEPVLNYVFKAKKCYFIEMRLSENGKPQTVEKVQRELGFLSYMWYNVNGDENVGRKEKF